MKKAWIGIGIVLILAGAVFIYQKVNPLANASGKLSGHLKSKGPENAIVTIVGYSDFQCPACQMSESILTEYMTKYSGKIRVVFRHFPLAMHLWSLVAHQAAECANQKGKFWEFHDQLFVTQKEWSNPANPTDRFLEFAKKLNLNLDQFAACLADPKVTDLVKADRRHGDDLKVQSTPTFFINGERVVGPMELKVKGEALIRQALGLPALPPEPQPSTEAPKPKASSKPAASAS